MASRYEGEPDPVHVLIGRLVQYFRQRANGGRGMFQTDVARRIGCSETLLAHFEHGRRPVGQPWLGRLDRVLGAEGMLIAAEEVVAFLRHTPAHQAHPEFEVEAAAIGYYATHVVPDLLQVPDYTRAVLAGQVPALTGHRIEEAVDRLARQQRTALERGRGGCLLSFVLDEAVLRRPFGGRKAMQEQLRHLLAVCEGLQPQVSVQVAPLDRGAVAALTRPTMVITTESGHTSVFVDGFDGTALIRDRAQTVGLAERYHQMRAHALPPAESAVLIKRIATDLEPNAGAAGPR